MTRGETNASQPKTSAELEREVESTRDSLTATLDEIKGRLSPANIADQVFDLSMISRGSQFATSLEQSVKANPVPTLLIGAGLAWLLASAGGGRPDDGADTKTGERRLRFSTRSIARTDEGRGSRAGVTAGPRAENVDGSYAAAAYAQVQTGKAVDKAELTLRGSGRAYEVSTAKRIRGSAQHMFKNGRQGLETMFEKQPLVLGAIGLAVGAAIGAALPTTHAENQWMGQRSDEIKRRARELAEEQYEHAREVATEMYEEVRDEIQAQGISNIPADIIEEVTERVKTVAETVRATAKESAEGAVGEVKKAVNGATETAKADTSKPQEEAAGKIASRTGEAELKTAAAGVARKPS